MLIIALRIIAVSIRNEANSSTYVVHKHHDIMCTIELGKEGQARGQSVPDMETPLAANPKGRIFANVSFPV